MKKYLLASSALASVALVSGLALAEASVSGSVSAHLATGAAFTGPTAYIDDADISVDGSGTTDNGWDYAANISIDLDSGEGPGSSDAVNFDNLSISLSGGFGQVALDHGDNAAGNMDIHGGAVAAATGGIDGNARSGFHGITTGAQGVSNALSYYSNNLSGLTFGVSLGLGGRNYNDSGTTEVVEVKAKNAVGTTPAVEAVAAVDPVYVKSVSGNAIGVKYSTGGLNVAFTSGSETTEDKPNSELRSKAGKAVAGGQALKVPNKVENTGTTFGVSYSVGALSFAFGMADKTEKKMVEKPPTTSGGDRTLKSREDGSSSTSLGVSFNHGAGAVSLTQVSSGFSTDGKDDKADSDLLAISYDRTLGEGIQVYAEYLSGTYAGVIDDDKSTDEKTVYDSGTEILLGTKISF